MLRERSDVAVTLSEEELLKFWGAVNCLDNQLRHDLEISLKDIARFDPRIAVNRRRELRRKLGDCVAHEFHLYVLSFDARSRKRLPQSKDIPRHKFKRRKHHGLAFHWRNSVSANG